jgi:hypothetical protein
MELSFGATAFCIDSPSVTVCPRGTSLMADAGEGAGEISRYVRGFGAARS